MKMKPDLHQCVSYLPPTFLKISIKDLSAKLQFPETFCNYPLHIILRFIWLYLFIEFFQLGICRAIFYLLSIKFVVEVYNIQ